MPFDEDQLDKLHEVFQGAASGGGLSEKALGQLLGQRDKWFCSRWFQAFNRSTTDDKINEDDFIAALDALVGKEAKPKAELLMRVFDEDGDGVLNPDEFREALDHTVQKCGLQFTEDKMESIKSHGFGGCDKNGDGVVCVDDLAQVLDGERVTRNSDMFRPANPKLKAALFPPKKPESTMLPTKSFQARKKELYVTFTVGHIFLEELTMCSMLMLKSDWAMLLLLALYILINVGLFAQAFARYMVICLNPETPCTLAVPVARGFGAMLNFDMAAIVLPMSRTLLTIIRHRFSRRWFALDEMISIHKFMGYTCMFASCGHTIGHMCNYALTLSYTPLGLMTRAGLTGHILLYGMAIILVGTFEIFRRGRGEHEIFHLSHYHWIIIFPVLLLHGPIFWIFFLLPGGLFLFEYCTRILFRFHAIPVIVGKQLPEGWENDKIAQRSRVLQLEIEKPWYSRYKPGQYYFVNFRQVSWYEWHPFSVTSTPGENLISFHIRALGDWTNDLYYKFSPDKQYGKWMAEGKKVEIRLDGPYGAPCEHFGEFKYLMLIATGIGVTPMVSILRTIKLQMMKAAGKDKKPPGYVKICLYWMNREQRAIEWFIDLLLDLQRSEGLSGLLELNLYITGLPGADISNGLLYNSMGEYKKNEGTDVMTDLNEPLTRGRPRWADIFKRNGEEHPGHWGVFFTGPPILAEELNKQSKQWSKNTDATFSFFKENF